MRSITVVAALLALTAPAYAQPVPQPAQPQAPTAQAPTAQAPPRARPPAQVQVPPPQAPAQPQVPTAQVPTAQVPPQASPPASRSLTAPKTLIERPTDARSAADIKRDNDLAAAVAKAVTDAGPIKASTEIYEQRLLVTGLFDDKPAYDRFEAAVRAIKGVKRLTWQVVYIARNDQEAQRKAGRLLDWPAVLAIETRARGRLMLTPGLADVNYRIAADAFGSVHVLGRARSPDERDKVLARLKDVEGVKKVISYIEVRR